MVREKLVPPAEYVLPKRGFTYKPHPLLELAELTSAQALRNQQEGEFDIKAALDTNQVMVVGQREEGFEYFAGRFVSSDTYKQSGDPDWFISELLKGTSLYLSFPSIRVFDGRVLKVRHRGLIFAQLFSENYKSRISIPADFEGGVKDRNEVWQNGLIAKYLSPDKLAQNPKHPQIFTFSTAFNPALDEWHFSKNPGFLEQLPPEKLAQFVNDFMFDGLGVLANESDNRYIRQAAQRLFDLRGSDRIGVNIALDSRYTLTQEFRVPEEKVEAYLPSEVAVPYLSNMDYAPANIQGFLIMPHDWIIAAGERPVVALAHLLYSASLARDHYFRKFEGTQIEGTRWGTYEISHAEEAKKRAGSMVSQLIIEATAYDQQRYGIKLNLDSFCRELLVKYPFGTSNNHHYDDPSQGKFNNNDSGPWNGPDDNCSRFPSRPPSLSGLA